MSDIHIAVEIPRWICFKVGMIPMAHQYTAVPAFRIAPSGKKVHPTLAGKTARRPERKRSVVDKRVVGEVKSLLMVTLFEVNYRRSDPRERLRRELSPYVRVLEWPLRLV